MEVIIKRMLFDKTTFRRIDYEKSFFRTRGVDIGVSEIIHQSILKLREAGSAILLITADFDELFKLSDRIGVIYEGHIVTEGKSEEYTPNRLGLYMGGGTDEDQAV